MPAGMVGGISAKAERHAYQQKPPRFEYRLIQKGRALLPVLQAICAWANHHLPHTWTAPRSFMEMTAE
jgi:DNA-binding HxlR family transcriptional regulator